MSEQVKELTVDLVRQLTGKKSLQDVTALSLTGMGLLELDGEILNKLVMLESLDISRNSLSAFPNGVCLPSLKVVDCSENLFESLSFVENFPKLIELYAEGNQVDDLSDILITRTYCPSLIKFDLCKNSSYLKVMKKYQEAVAKQVCSTWESEYGGKYEIDGISNYSQFHNVLRTFIHKVKQTDSIMALCKVDEHLIKFVCFMVDKLCLKLIECVQSGLYKNQLLTGGRIQDLLSDTSNSQRPSRAASINPKQNKNQNDTLRRKIILDENSRAKKIRKTAKTTKHELENLVTFTSLRDSPDVKKSMVMSPMSDYDPTYFLRCNSANNEPNDDETEIWSCQFEPNPNKPGETTNIVAVCGGCIVSLIDCQTGKVMRRYKDPDEHFYALSWSTLSIQDGERKTKMNIMAVGGFKSDILLIHPSQLVMYARIDAHRERINSLLFHPEQPTHLFSASLDHTVILWDVGIPDFGDYTTQYRKLMTLITPGTEPLNLAWSLPSNFLVVGCEDGCHVWRMGTKKDRRPPDFRVRPPTEGVDGSPSLDGMVLLTDNLIGEFC
ncbi:hypothetical protein ScPMuIL_006113 [Solemya velum]